MLYRARGASAEVGSGADEILAGYGDGDKVASWARPQVAYAVQSGLLQGSGGKLNPLANATRAEAATVILRALDVAGRITKKD